MSRIITILAEGFEETEAVTFIDLLRRAQIEVIIVGLESLEVRGSHNIVIKADTLLESISGAFDGIVLPGGQPGTKNLINSNKVIELIQYTYKKGLLCAAICAAPSIFGKAGILENRHATCYPGVENDLTGAILSNAPVVRDGTIITSRGVATAIPFSLELINFLEGPEMASKIGSAILHS